MIEPEERRRRQAPELPPVEWIVGVRVACAAVAVASGIVGGLALATVHPLLGAILGLILYPAPAAALAFLADDLPRWASLLTLLGLVIVALVSILMLVDLSTGETVAIGLAPLVAGGIVLGAWTAAVGIRDLRGLDDGPFT